MKRAKKQTAKDWREVKTIDEADIRYLVTRIICGDWKDRPAALLLLIDAIQHDRTDLAADAAKKAALYESDAGDGLTESYTKMLRSYFSREGNSSQPPDIEGALQVLNDELRRALNSD